jgi:hypothetical protein
MSQTNESLNDIIEGIKKEGEDLTEFPKFFSKVSYLIHDAEAMFEKRDINLDGNGITICFWPESIFSDCEEQYFQVHLSLIKPLDDEFSRSFTKWFGENGNHYNGSRVEESIPFLERSLARFAKTNCLTTAEKQRVVEAFRKVTGMNSTYEMVAKIRDALNNAQLEEK